MTTKLIEVKNITMDFAIGGGGLFGKERMRALNDVSFSLKKGRALGLVGESGSGKSTCARILSRIYEPSLGDIYFKGKNIQEIKNKTEIKNYKSKIQMIFQDPFGSLNPTHTIKYHIERPLLINKTVTERKSLLPKIYELLDLVGLTPVEETARKFPHEISGGQRQRVAIARVLAMEPEIILADEPTSMLDVSIRIGILNLMEDLKIQKQLSFLYITHDIATARYFAEDTAVMYAGHIVEWGDSESITQKPQHPYTKLLIDSVPNPEKHFFVKESGSPKAEIPLWRPDSNGCPFAGRCNQVKKECHYKMANTKSLGENHFVRCHLF